MDIIDKCVNENKTVFSVLINEEVIDDFDRLVKGEKDSGSKIIEKLIIRWMKDKAG